MRISYSEEEDYPGQHDLWQGNCMRSIKGKKGQAALRELEQVLLAMPEKRLIANELETEQGDVCAIGALARHRNYTPKADPDGEMELVGVELGMPELVAWKVVALNDIDIDFYYNRKEGRCVPYTPEERYEKVLAQVQEWLKPDTDATAAKAT